MVQLSSRLFGRTISVRLPLVATSVRSRIRPAATSSSACRPWLNWVAPIGSPPVMRLTMIGRAVSPEPAIAPSTHLLPVASKALANSATAAASPPEVHQWVTSRSVANAAQGTATDAARAAASERLIMGEPPDGCLHRYSLDPTGMGGFTQWSICAAGNPGPAQPSHSEHRDWLPIITDG